MNHEKYNIALLSNFTIKGLEKYLKIFAARYNIHIDIYVGEYGQWQQEILGERLYSFNSHLVYIIVDFEDTEKQWILIDELARKTTAKIIVCNQVPDRESIIKTNQQLAERYQDDGQIIVFDFANWINKIGKDKYWGTKYRELGDMRLAPTAFSLLAEELGSFLIPLSGQTRKCLVLDLDNTLWGKVVGEEGMAGISLGPQGDGRPYYEFQKSIKALKERGIILAINSSNNEADVKEVLENHEHMLLRLDDFSASRANWNNKADNLKEIAAELNIGLDSMVFIDDDPRNRELVRTSLPEVAVIDLPKDAAEYVNILESYRGFTVFSLTTEDKNRSQMYLDERKRREFKSTVIDLNRFLRALDLSIIIRRLTGEHLSRAAQLTQKTNQFNLTTRRYQEEDIKLLLSQGAYAWTLEVKDKFGDYGLTGFVLVRDVGQWEIDTLLISCRVLGKKIEQEFFGQILRFLKEKKSQKVAGFYIPTAKNNQVKDFYEGFGFLKIRNSDSADIWEKDLNSHNHQTVDFIKTTII